jgi:EthD domain-containing protein
MEKLVYLLRKRDADAIERFRGELLERACARFLERGVRWLTINVADLGEQAKQSPLLLGDGRFLSASVSLWLDSLDQRGPLEEELHGLSDRLWGYLVTESVPIEYPDRDWADGTKSPGVTLVSAFPKPERLSDEQFYGHWHGVHTPLSFEIHPFWRYIRNAVARRVTAEGPPYRGIVEERVRDIEDVIDVMRLFRGKSENITRGLEDVNQFIDQADISCSLMSEYIIKS